MEDLTTAVFAEDVLGSRMCVGVCVCIVLEEFLFEETKRSFVISTEVDVFSSRTGKMKKYVNIFQLWKKPDSLSYNRSGSQYSDVI